MTQEALKLALEALESCDEGDWSTGHVIHPSYDEDAVAKAIAAIKEALREHAMREVQRLGQEIEQEPVKYSDYEPDGVHHTTPPQRTWVGLTDEEYAELAEEFGPFPINQIEAKLKEKNT